MFQQIWEIIAIPLGFIMRWCYLLVNDVMHLPVSYVFALVLFTLLSKLLMFPVSLKQQRTQAITMAYQPMINEINKKYAKDQKKRAEELEKLQKEYGYNPMSGCLPMLLPLPIVFGLMEVVYRPLTYMMRIPAAAVAALTDKARVLLGSNVVERYIETSVIELIKNKSIQLADITAGGVSSADMGGYIQGITDLDMTIGSVNLWEVPKLAWSVALLVPLFSIVTMLLSSFIMTWAARGRMQQDKAAQRSGMVTMVLSSGMFAFFSFQLPAAFSLYWGFGNIISIIQSFVLRKIVNADTIRAKAEARIEEKRRQAKEVKKVKVKVSGTGEETEKELAGSELARYRLQKAREMDEARYSAAAALEETESAAPEPAEPEENKETGGGEPPKRGKGKRKKKE